MMSVNVTASRMLFLTVDPVYSTLQLDVPPTQQASYNNTLIVEDIP